MASKIIQAAGGIVVRRGKRPLVAVVQRSKDDAWVLPRGKLKRDENPVKGARREVVEETGHRVHVHEFLGAITYRAQGRPKVVQFWRMQADKRPSHDVMSDIAAVEWLTVKAAVRRLSYPLEKLFLRNVASLAVPARKRRARRKAARTARKSAAKKLAAAAAKKKKTARKSHPPGKAHKTRRPKAAPHRHTRHQVKARAHARSSKSTRQYAPRATAVKQSVAGAKTILQRVLGRLAG